MKRALIVVARRPLPGWTKTRLSPLLAPEEASRLYECFLRDTLDLARSVPGVDRFVAYAPVEGLEYFRDVAPDFQLLAQAGADLGARLEKVLSACLGRGYGQAVVMASDSPTLPAAHLARAFDLLVRADLVLGPSNDGGYYLLGLSRLPSRVLREVEMSTPHVLRDTLALAEQEGLSVALLPRCFDVDTPEDLWRLRAELATAPAGLAKHTRDYLSQREIRQ